MARNKELTAEELEFKRKSKNRLFFLFIFLDLFFIGYLIYQIVTLAK